MSILNGYSVIGALSVTYAMYREKIIVYHVYLMDTKIALLQCSASLYRTDQTITSSIMGMANRLLHYDDMLTLKRMGMTILDWGGISDQEEIKNITAFKREFGGTEVDTIFTIEGVSLLGKAALFLKDWIRGTSSYSENEL